MPGVLAKCCRERLQPGFVGVAQRQRQDKAGRYRSLGRKIRQIHPQRLAGNRVRRIIREKMDAFDDSIRCDNEIVA